MDYRQKIIERIDKFYVEAIEEFREAEAKIISDSRFRRIFQKKDYSGNIKMLKYCKNIASGITFPENEIPQEDGESRDIVKKCRECIRIFGKLCDSYVSMQVALDKKARGENLSYKEYKKIYNQTKEDHDSLNSAIKDLDILYADYMDYSGSSSGGDGYMTYDMIAGGKGRK